MILLLAWDATAKMIPLGSNAASEGDGRLSNP